MDNSVHDISLQWIKGDKIGNVERVENQDSEWTTFHSGSRIATSLIHEFMIPIEGDPLDLDQPAVDTITNKNDLDHHPSKLTVTNKQEDSPIRTLFDKQKKTDKVDLNLTFSINIPQKDIFDIIRMSFGETEVITELYSFISDQIDHNDLNDALVVSIKELIQKHFT